MQCIGSGTVRSEVSSVKLNVGVEDALKLCGFWIFDSNRANKAVQIVTYPTCEPELIKPPNLNEAQAVG